MANMKPTVELEVKAVLHLYRVDVSLRGQELENLVTAWLEHKLLDPQDQQKLGTVVVTEMDIGPAEM